MGGGAGRGRDVPDSSSSMLPLLRETLTLPVVELKLVMLSVMGCFLPR